MGNYFLAMKLSVFMDVLLVKLKPGLTHWQPKKAGAVWCQWSRAKLNESLNCMERGECLEWTRHRIPSAAGNPALQM
ncbi:hypothetical protein [Salinicola sp. MH3R3-1]|uniref:hypothetical protein n=1 Tax=Salinicola sp. MH3R3-1 TaxID=1928762 RepID=UPI0011152997|nr:hypothetical protein [Salinicola sp. MH3R3-1]